MTGHCAAEQQACLAPFWNCVLPLFLSTTNWKSHESPSFKYLLTFSQKSKLFARSYHSNLHMQGNSVTSHIDFPRRLLSFPDKSVKEWKLVDGLYARINVNQTRTSPDQVERLDTKTDVFRIGEQEVPELKDSAPVYCLTEDGMFCVPPDLIFVVLDKGRTSIKTPTVDGQLSETGKVRSISVDWTPISNATSAKVWKQTLIIFP